MGIVSGIRQFFSGAKRDPQSKPPAFLAFRSSKSLILLTVALAIFTDIFYYALIVPVVPFSLTIQVGIPQDKVQHWTSILLSCYSVALFVGSPLAGLYADHTTSRRWPLLIGLVSLAASTVMLCFGHTIALLVVGRLLQGFSASIVWSVGCALLVDTMKDAIGVALGYLGVAMSVGMLIAPVIGGVVYEAAGYYAVYYIAFGVVAVDILLRLIMIEKKVAKQWIPEDEDTGALGTGVVQRDVEAATSPIGGLTRQKSTGANSMRIADQESAPKNDNKLEKEIDEKQGGVVSSTDDDSTTSTTKSPKVHPIRILLRSRRLVAALYCLFTQSGIMMGFDATLALFVQTTFQWNSTAAGIMFLAMFVPAFISPFVGWLSDKYGAKRPSFCGFCMCIPLLVCLRFVTQNTIQHKILLGFLLCPLGFALSFANVPLMAEVTYVIEDIAAKTPGIFGEKGVYGLGYGLYTMAFALGGTIGPIWGGYVVQSAGWGTMTWSFAIWAASGAVVVFFWVGVKVNRARETEETGVTE
ncbi:MFS general substrate transporter [Annulohypoxylon maeteangense]|uniref:MFS general substrate transporter n=1 Tax=Annulohypoxylon maeteangense TaxID=1927788 RepID=UPI00200759B7|nr:MFS general substrate transporter [Annulohypoxylon maeteangense]KAI0880268.1 MFS general substrate transporter [Annulohypoxylon maeteangense]